MSDAKSMQVNKQQKKANNIENRLPPFTNLFIKFESIKDCQFSVIVTFPEEEDLLRRKKLADQANQSLLAQDMKSNNSDEDEKNSRSVNNGRLVAATQFKKKMAREVKSIVEDYEAAEVFLKNVAQKKLQRKRRNIQAMINNSTNPDKQEVDFIKANIDDFSDNKDKKELKKQQDLALKYTR